MIQTAFTFAFYVLVTCVCRLKWISNQNNKIFILISHVDFEVSLVSFTTSSLREKKFQINSTLLNNVIVLFWREIHLSQEYNYYYLPQCNFFLIPFILWHFWISSKLQHIKVICRKGDFFCSNLKVLTVSSRYWHVECSSLYPWAFVKAILISGRHVKFDFPRMESAAKITDFLKKKRRKKLNLPKLWWLAIAIWVVSRIALN